MSWISRDIFIGIAKFLDYYDIENLCKATERFGKYVAIQYFGKF